jgi:CHAD domain-containing protein
MLISDVASERRAAALRGLQKEIDCPRFTYFMIGLLGWTNAGENRSLGSAALNQPIAKQMPLLLDVIYNKARKRRQHVGRDDASTHNFRKSMKKMRYAVEYSESLWSQRAVTAFIKPCKKLQTRLGNINDAAMARELVVNMLADEPGVVPVAAELLDWIDQRKKSANKKAASSLKGFDNAQPYWR